MRFVMATVTGRGVFRRVAKNGDNEDPDKSVAPADGEKEGEYRLRADQIGDLTQHALPSPAITASPGAAAGATEEVQCHPHLLFGRYRCGRQAIVEAE